MSNLIIRTLSSSSKGNCHILESNGSSIMIDCGLPAKTIVEFCDISKLESVFITHRHADHSKGVQDLSIYTTCNYYMNEDCCEHLDVWGDKKVPILQDTKIIYTDNFDVIPFNVYHDVPNTNFLIRHRKSGIKVLYITDTSDISNLRFKDVDVFMVEGNFSLEWDLSSDKYKRTNSEHGHLPIEKTMEFLENNVNEETKAIFITHISHSFKKYYEFEDMVQSKFGDKIVKAINNRTIEIQEFVVTKED